MKEHGEEGGGEGGGKRRKIRKKRRKGGRERTGKGGVGRTGRRKWSQESPIWGERIPTRRKSEYEFPTSCQNLACK